MERLITGPYGWFIFGLSVGYIFMFIMALLAIKKITSDYRTEIYDLRLNLKNEKDRNKTLKDEIKLVEYWKKAIDSLETDYGKEINQIITNEFEANEEKE